MGSRKHAKNRLERQALMIEILIKTAELDESDPGAATRLRVRAATKRSMRENINE